jgi:hypothetical protein
MYISIDPKRAPLRANASPAAQALSLDRLKAQIAARGIDLITDGDALRLSLQRLPQVVGYDHAKVVLAETLQELGVDAVDWEEEDLAFIEQPNQYNAAAALNGFSRNTAKRMQGILLDDDGSPGAVFDALDAVPELVRAEHRAAQHARQQQIEWLKEKRDAEINQQIAQLEGGDQSYRTALDGPQERAPKAHPDFEADVPRYRDPHEGGW